MKEPCRRDNEANRNRDVNTNLNHNEFSVTDIHKRVLSPYELERVIDSLQRFEMDSDDPVLEFMDQDRRERVRLTDTGRALCGELGYKSTRENLN
jgi:hypothetical protein